MQPSHVATQEQPWACQVAQSLMRPVQEHRRQVRLHSHRFAVWSHLLWLPLCACALEPTREDVRQEALHKVPQMKLKPRDIFMWHATNFFLGGCCATISCQFLPLVLDGAEEAIAFVVACGAWFQVAVWLLFFPCHESLPWRVGPWIFWTLGDGVTQWQTKILSESAPV